VKLKKNVSINEKVHPNDDKKLYINETFKKIIYAFVLIVKTDIPGLFRLHQGKSNTQCVSNNY
jgi:hypothetical protein